MKGATSLVRPWHLQNDQGLLDADRRVKERSRDARSSRASLAGDGRNGTFTAYVGYLRVTDDICEKPRREEKIRDRKRRKILETLEKWLEPAAGF